MTAQEWEESQNPPMDVSNQVRRLVAQLRTHIRNATSEDMNIVFDHLRESQSKILNDDLISSTSSYTILSILEHLANQIGFEEDSGSESMLVSREANKASQS